MGTMKVPTLLPMPAGHAKFNAEALDSLARQLRLPAGFPVITMVEYDVRDDWTPIVTTIKFDDVTLSNTHAIVEAVASDVSRKIVESDTRLERHPELNGFDGLRVRWHWPDSIAVAQRVEVEPIADGDATWRMTSWVAIDEPDLPELHELDAEQVSHLSPGIRDLVLALRAAGFNTTDSGDGSNHEQGMACAVPFRMVAITCHPADLASTADRLAVWLQDNPLDWPVYRVEATYNPLDGVGAILLHEQDDEFCDYVESITGERPSGLC